MLTQLQKFGLSGELQVFSVLDQLGYSPVLLSDFFSDYDLLISGCCRVEVKKARARFQSNGRLRRRCWQFNLTNLSRDVDCLVVLVCEADEQDYYFVVPSWVFFGRYVVSITSHPTRYRGRLAQYLGAWHLVPEVVAQALKYSPQLRLF